MSQQFRSGNKNTFYLGEFLIIVIYFIALAIFSVFYLTNLYAPANARYYYNFHISSLLDIITLSMIGYTIVQDILLVIVGILFYMISKKISTSFLLTKKGIIIYFLVAYVAIFVPLLILVIIDLITNSTSNTNLLNSLTGTLMSFGLNAITDKIYTIIRLFFDYLPTLMTWYLFSTFINFKRE